METFFFFTFKMWLQNFFFFLFLKIVYSSSLSSQSLSPSSSILDTIKFDYLYDQQWQLIQGISSSLNQVNISQECKLSLDNLTFGFLENSKMALNFIDTWPKMGQGILAHEFANYGNYDKCLKNQDNKYCLYRFHWPLPLDNPEKIVISESDKDQPWIQKLGNNYRHLYLHPPVGGFCLPNSCTGEEFENILRNIFLKWIPEIKIELYQHCDQVVPKYQNSSKIQNLAASFILILIFLTFISTFGILIFGDKYFPPILRHFDARGHFVKLFYLPRNQQAERLLVINGARFLYLFLTVFVHIYYTQIAYVPAFYGVNFFNEKIKPSTNFILSAFTNFTSVNFILGALLSYITWAPQISKRSGKLPLIPFLIGRWCRTTPMVIFTLAVIFGFPKSGFGDGPVFHIGIQNITDNCLKTLTSELMYTSNQGKAVYACIPHGWYMSADFQLYVLSMPLLILLVTRPKIGMLITIAIAVIAGPLCQMYNFWIYQSGVNWSLTHSDLPKMGAESHILHFFMSNYISTYCLGLIIGHMFANDILIESKITLTAGWIFALSSLFGAFYISNYLKLSEQENYQQNRFFEIFLGSLLKPLVSIFFAYLIYVCVIDQAGFLGPLFRSKALIPLGRISYSTFMAHYLFIWYESFTTRSQISYDTMSIIMRMISTVVCSYALGFIAYILCEAPFDTLLKAAFRRKKDKDQ